MATCRELRSDQHADSMVDCGSEGECSFLRNDHSPNPPNYPTSRVEACCESMMCCGNPKCQSPFWLKAKTLNAQELS